DHMTATLAERPFFLASFQGARSRCGRGGVAPQAVVGQDASPPAPVLGYSNTFFFVSSVPFLEELSAIPVSRFWGPLHLLIGIALAEIAETRPTSRSGGIRLAAGGAVGQSSAKGPPDAGPIGERLFLARHELDGELRVAGA